MSDTSWETPEEDAAEQQVSVVPEVPADGPLEVDPADAQEQRDEVPLDDEEWR